MRVPSRRLPPRLTARPSPVSQLIGRAFLCALTGGGVSIAVEAGEMLRRYPAATIVAGVVVVLLGGLVALAEDTPSPKRLAALVDLRPGDALCRFARDFDCRTVDTWLIRAVFEEVTSRCGKRAV